MISVPLILAPMARYTHRPFRQLIAELGGATLLYTEMLNARIVCNSNPIKDIFCQRGEKDIPTVAQVVGGDPDIVSKAIKRLEPLGFEGFDINMSCPNGAIVRYGWGIALQKDPDRAFAIVQRAREATKRPLFVKLRSWPNHNMEHMLQFCIKLQAFGIDGITLHPRDEQDGFKRPAKWQEIKYLKDALKIPVFGNGDVKDIQTATILLETTGCDAIMIGRAALVRPWIFWEITNGRKWEGCPLEVMERMGTLMDAYFPDKNYALKIFKAFLSWFLRNWQFHRHFYGRIINLQDISSVTACLSRLLKNAPLLEQIPLVAKL